MSIEELYTKGARVWVRDPDEVWIGGTLTKDYKPGGNIEVELEEDGLEKTLKIKSKDDMPPLRNPEILIGENDLTSLSYLHEPAVLYNLNVRFIQNNAIYTYCGIVLVAINPYEQLPLYGEDVINAYHGQDMAGMDPHIFAVAEEAFKQLTRFEQDQSIIVSGESGAGKTVSAKYAMRYFATVGGSYEETQVEKKVLASNPIMESIGNAKTTRNDNSSRFGKYVEISFNKSHHIIGAHMRTYLLEKSRVVFQASEERNYHIFYQLCASTDLPEFKELQLGDPDAFFFTNQGEAPEVVGINDRQQLEDTRDAFQLVGISEETQMSIFRVVAAVLHFGNVEVKPERGDNSSIELKESELCYLEKENENIGILCKLLGIDESQMRKWLVNRKIVTVREVLTKPLPYQHALNGRDALAKHIYAQLFKWIVKQVNKALVPTIKAQNFIGVLDIYGFEMFDINSFEQFCINYANEKLQQQFTQHVFKLEQEEYIREKIEWNMIDFYDNQPCIDLIENKLGILDLLDEECMVPKGNDDNWCQKLYSQHVKKSKHFSKPRTSNNSFVVHHFADKVEYTAEGFVEKNRDNVNDEHLNILRASQYEFVAELFRDKNAKVQDPKKAVVKPMAAAVRTQKQFKKSVGSQDKKSSKEMKKSVGSQFRDSLKILMSKLNSTTPHYVRCIKPNDCKEPFSYEPKRAVEQLRACGVLETIRISAAGFPSRWTYPEFFSRYRVLMLKKEINKSNMRGTAEKILNRLITDPDKYQFGKTKIFFRAGQVAYMEKLRADLLKAACIRMQKTVRGYLQRKRYNRMKAAAIVLQKHVRAMNARRLTRFMRRTRAAIRLQKVWRRYHQRKAYLHIRRAIITIQAFTRGTFGRRYYKEVLRQARATTIQRYTRGWLARRSYQKTRKSIILLQCCTRRMYAKKELKRLKIEAKSVEHFKKLNRGMENKIIELQQKLNQQVKISSQNKEKEEVISKLETKVKEMETREVEMDVLQKKTVVIEDELTKIKRELEETRAERDKLILDMKAAQEQYQQEKDVLEAESDKLRKDVLEKENLLKEQDEKLEGEIKRQVEVGMAELKKELDDERYNHQKLVQDYSRLEQRKQNLEDEIKTLEVQPMERHVVMDAKEGSESGYGTLSTTESEDAESVATEIAEQGQEKASMDMSIFLKLQRRLKDLEKDKKQLEQDLEKKDNVSKGRSDSLENELHNTNLQIQRLREENTKLKGEVDMYKESLEKATKGDTTQAIKVYNQQIEVLNLENEKHRDEIIRLKSEHLTKQHKNSTEVEDAGTNTDRQLYIDQAAEDLNQDGDLEMAYQSLKMTNHLITALSASQSSLHETVHKYGDLAGTQNELLIQKLILEKELQAQTKNHEHEVKQLKEELKKVMKDNNRQQEIIGENLKLKPEDRVNAIAQHEITRLTTENMDLMEQNEYLEKNVKKLKKQLKAAHKKLTSVGELAPSITPTTDSPVALLPNHHEGTPNHGPAVRHKERDLMGIIEYSPDDEPRLIKSIILDFRPKMNDGYLPGLPAYIIFMCIRHADYTNNDQKIKTLLTGVINSIKKTVKKHFEEFEYVSFWLTNTCRLLHNLKQYSGEENFSAQNSDFQNEHCLRNFDLSEYRRVMNDLAVHIYQMLVRIIENQVQQMIVPAMLESDSAGLTANKPTGMRGRSSSSVNNPQQEMRNVSIESIIKQLSIYLAVMNSHGVDPQLIRQVMKQTFYLVTSTTINNLLLRKEMCHWSKGVQIRYNLSELEEWLRTNNMFDQGMENILEPLVQIAQLLQVKKRTDDDVKLICDTCSMLTTTQIVKILSLYTPDEYESRTEMSFIRKVQHRLKNRSDMKREAQLLIDSRHQIPVTFPYNPSSVLLNEIQIPATFNINYVQCI
ncbi:unconventional myosin-Va-like isoform X3 [Anneissia japonica]|uniref:unconventional myosin-Va-like isoform X3 n=1 Tax=Anneissia japonica TaxID=1529436 RepID=UPI00142561B9|nr:unconventional myosin-Va-like isoform X3 [Anneissia japonica]